MSRSRRAKKAFSVSDAERLANVFFPDGTGVLDGYRFTVSEYERAIQNRVDLNKMDTAEMYAKEMRSEEAYKNAYLPVDTISFDTIPQIVRVQTKDKNGIIFANEESITIQEAGNALVHWKELVEEEGSFEGDTPRPVNPKNTAEEAIRSAEAFLEKVGIEGFLPAAYREVRFFDSFYMEGISIGWNIQFVKAYEYYPLDLSEGGNGVFHVDLNAAAKAWNNEMITIYVSEEGEVQSFCWEYPTEVLSVANENVRLMPLEELEPIMKRFITYGLAPAIKDNGRTLIYGHTFRLTRLYLSVSLQPVKDDIDKAYVMPTWICCFELHDKHPRTGEVDDRIVALYYYGFNAIDGTYLNLNTIYGPHEEE